LVEVAPVVEARQRVVEREGCDIGVQEGVGERKRSVAGEQLEGFELDRPEARSRIDAPDRDGADDHAVANQGDADGQRDGHDRMPANRRRIAWRTEVLVDDRHAIPEGSAGDAVTRTDLGSDGPWLDAL